MLTKTTFNETKSFKYSIIYLITLLNGLRLHNQFVSLVHLGTHRDVV